MTDIAGTQGYGSEADRLAVQYESITFEDVHAAVLHLLPVMPGRVLDVGAGTGRDAAALAARGHRVTAAEPTAALRQHGMALHPDPRITWVEDGLPGLHGIAGPYDLIMLTAVWMHLDAGERAAGMPRLAGLMVPGAVLAMTLRHGPVPSGRRMFDVSGAETAALAMPYGLKTIFEAQRGDMFGRGVTWTHLVFRRT